MAQKVLYALLLIGAALFGVGVILFFTQNSCYAQTPYFGPNYPVEGMIRVDVSVSDAPELDGVKITDASFDGQSIPLKPAGIHGYRGGAGFKKPPGNYDLIWIVSKAGSTWPRTVRHQQKVRIRSSDSWVQVVIEGETAEVK
jgi:hypothetical protein